MCLIIASASRAGVAIGETESTASWHSRHSQPDPKLAPKPGKPVAKKGVLAVPDGIGVTRDVEYARVEGRKLLLDIYLPEAPAKAPPAPPATPATSAPGDAGKEPSTIQPDAHEPGEADGASRATSTGRHQARPPLPVIIWIHGGGWESGTKDASPAARLVSFGYAAVSISYRFSQIAPYPAQIHDCKAAIRWVRAHAKEYNFDPDRIGVWGASAGGHLAALLGTSAGDQELEGEIGGHLDQSSAVQAVCDWFGPTDMIKLCRMASGESAEDAALPRPDFVIPARNTGETSTQRKDAAPAATTADDKVPPRSYPKLITPAPLRKLFGGNIQDHLQLAVLANPVTFIDKSDAP
ncbi:MAG: alpha/beta hydrolase, partial [Pyrinomonadaceae bacterium]|nr:alpha/beta hydrolase [Phycisphaerales bacterium]